MGTHELPLWNRTNNYRPTPCVLPVAIEFSRIMRRVRRRTVLNLITCLMRFARVTLWLCGSSISWSGACRILWTGWIAYNSWWWDSKVWRRTWRLPRREVSWTSMFLQQWRSSDETWYANVPMPACMQPGYGGHAGGQPSKLTEEKRPQIREFYQSPCSHRTGDRQPIPGHQTNYLQQYKSITS